MNLLTYYIKRNKGFLISSLILFISIIATLGIPGVILKSAMPGNYINISSLESKVFFVLSLLAIVLIVILLISTLINLLNNSLGKKRTMLMVFYGKKKTMIYQMVLTIVLVGFMYLIFSYGITTFFLVFKMNAGFLVNDIIKENYFSMISEAAIVLSIYGTIALYMFLSLKETLLNTSLKYDKPSKKIMYITFRVVMYLVLLFLLLYRNMPALANLYFQEITTTYRFEFDTSLYAYFAVVTLIIVVIDYIKISKDKMFR